jgi:hypothetical protein
LLQHFANSFKKGIRPTIWIYEQLHDLQIKMFDQVFFGGIECLIKWLGVLMITKGIDRVRDGQA